jgi:hypothetical protein
MIPYAFSALVLAGGILNILKRPSGFVCWIVSNGYFATTTGLAGHYAEAATFTANFGLAIYGFYSWRKTA